MKNQRSFQFLSALSLAVALATLPAVAQNPPEEMVTVTLGGTHVISTPFVIEGFSVARQDIINAVELSGGRSIQVSGVRPGSTDLLIAGAGRNLVYRITVIEDVRNVLHSLMRDLDTVPEVQLAISGPRVVVRGEVNSIDNWRLLQRVLPVYGTQVLNLATFRPAPEVMQQLHQSLERAGFTVIGPDEDMRTGAVQLRFSGNNLFVQARFYVERDIERLHGVMRSHPWLILVDNMDRELPADDPRVRTVLNVELVPTMLEVEIAFIGVTESEYRQIGVNLARAGLLAIDTTSAAFQGTIGRDRRSGFTGGYTIGSGMQGALQFFQSDGPGSFVQRAHLTFRNDSPEWRSYQSGGTLKVRVASQNAVGLEDIDYGLIMRVRGGLLDESNIRMDLDLELSYPQPVGGDYDLRRNRINTSVNTPLGHTMVLGGMRGMMEQAGNEGVPFLRSIPVVSWLFAERTNLKTDSHILILVSPYLAQESEPRSLPPMSEEPMPPVAPEPPPLIEDGARRPPSERPSRERGAVRTTIMR